VRPGALKIRQPPASKAPVEAPPTHTPDEVGAAAPLAADAAPAAAAAPMTPAQSAAPPATPGAPSGASGTTAAESPASSAPPAPAPAPASAPSGAGEAVAAAPPQDPSFRERAALRRRLRFLRSARELAIRDLGGLVFELHRFGRSREDLVGAKLATVTRIDAELRLLERALADRQPVTVLHETGIAACVRCAAIHGSDARFCPNCGLAVGRPAHMPMAGPAITPESAPAPAQGSDTPAEAPAASAPAGPAAAPASASAPSSGAGPSNRAEPTPDGGPDTPLERRPSTAGANGEGSGHPAVGSVSGEDRSEQPTRVVEALSAEDGEPTAR
jgi:hypothetical protein